MNAKGLFCKYKDQWRCEFEYKTRHSKATKNLLGCEGRIPKRMLRACLKSDTALYTQFSI